MRYEDAGGKPLNSQTQKWDELQWKELDKFFKDMNVEYNGNDVGEATYKKYNLEFRKAKIQNMKCPNPQDKLQAYRDFYW